MRKKLVVIYIKTATIVTTLAVFGIIIASIALNTREIPNLASHIQTIWLLVHLTCVIPLLVLSTIHTINKNR